MCAGHAQELKTQLGGVRGVQILAGLNGSLSASETSDRSNVRYLSVTPPASNFAEYRSPLIA